MSLVVAVPVNQLRVVPRKGSKLLLHLVVVCGWFEFSRYMADMMEVLLDLYMSCILDSSNCRVVSSWVDADGCCSKDRRELLSPSELPLEELPVLFQISK